MTVPKAAAEGMGSFLIDRGAPGLITEDVDDDHVRLTAHFLAPVPLAAVQGFCESFPELFPSMGIPQIRTEQVTEEAWADNWKENFPPLIIGERLFVHPPWIREVPPERLGVVIDPGMAFGTGQHATTRGCLMLLERFLSTKRRALVLDLGTGSGILAIAAAKLGAERVWAVDVDPEACRAALDNSAENGVGERIVVSESTADLPVYCDLVLANLLAGQLVEFGPRIAEWLRPGGVVIGSGVLDEEEETVARAWARAGFAPLERYQEGEWVTLAWELADYS